MKQDVFVKRRKKFIEYMAPNSIAILVAAEERRRNGDVYFNYRQNSDFYYLTGFEEPEAIALLVKGVKKEEGGRYILFNRPHDSEEEKWSGLRIGQAGAVKDFKADESYRQTELDQRLLEYLKNKEVIYFAWGKNIELDQKVNNCISQLRKKRHSSEYVPDQMISTERFLHEMRLIKEPEEIDLIRKAASITAQAHLKVMQSCCAGMKEFELEALLYYEFKRNGAREVAFCPVIAGGARACTLHYEKKSEELKEGELVLIDAGCEYGYYSADMTRTFPINGKFSKEQRAIYEIVLKAQLRAIKESRPGKTWQDVQAVAVQVITEGLSDLGLLNGKLSQLIEEGAYKRFFVHYIGHWLGLNVHDDGTYKKEGKWRKLEPGMVLTIEPGLYIPPDEEVDKKWRGIGVRIEDDLLITEEGNEILTKGGAPKGIADIEAVMQKRKDLG